MKTTGLNPMNEDKVLSIRNRQKVIDIDSRTFRRLVLSIIRDEMDIECFEIGCYLVDHREIERLNTTYLKHQGPTDVITFNHLDKTGFSLENRSSHVLKDARSPRRIHGEIFICVAEALSQSRTYGTTWQGEVIRYVIHGLLHLLGYDDIKDACRRRMKRVENRLVRNVQQRFPVGELVAKRSSYPGHPVR